MPRKKGIDFPPSPAAPTPAEPQPFTSVPDATPAGMGEDLRWEVGATLNKSVGSEPVTTDPEPFVSTVDATPAAAIPAKKIDNLQLGDSTPAENKAAFVDAVERVKAISEIRPVNSTQEYFASKRNEIVGEAQEKYFSALVEHHKKRGLSSIAIESLTGRHPGDEGSNKELRKLRAEWIESRARYKEFLASDSDIEKRFTDKYTGRAEVLDRLRAKHASQNSGPNYEVAVKRRYERMMINRAALTGAAEQELAAKKEGLALREKKSFDRMLEQYKQMHPAKRVLVTSALLTGGIAGVSAAAGGAFAVSALVIASSASSAGLHWLSQAQKSKNPRVSKLLGVLGGLTSLTGIVGAAGEAAVRGTHAVIRTKEKAEDRLQANVIDDLGDTSELLEAINERKSNLTKSEQIERQSRWGRIIGSIAGGALLGSWLRGGDSSVVASSAESDTASAGNGGESATNSSSPVAESTSGDAAQSGTVGQESAGGATESSSGTSGAAESGPEARFTASVDQRGEGTDSVFLDLKNQVEAAGIPSDQQSPALRHFLESHQNELSRGMGAETYGERGMITQLGDQLYMDENQNIWFKAANGEPQLYIENKPGAEGGFVVHTVEGEALPATAGTAPSPDSSAPAEQASVGTEGASTVETTQSAQTTTNGTQNAQTNDGIVFPPDSEFTVWSEGDSPESLNQRPDLVWSMDDAPQAPQGPTVPDSAPPAAPPQERGIMGLEEWTASQTQNPDGTRLDQLTIEDTLRPEASVEPLINQHGVEVLPNTPAIYELSQAAGTEPSIFIHGGPAEAGEQLAREYAMQHPGTSVQFVIENREPLTGEVLSRTVGSWTVNAGGQMIREDVLRNADGSIMSPPNPDTFTRKITS